ncbi:putative carboxypeptidase D [Helianthus annuus]|uniref:Carboxypeptidase n=1 Tax=Helianthus annuus TaxID=4232 RepID=A0A9K3HQ77_HELAN|nr:serine carboxypeptidase-like 31 [Helianthus annuus]KAF5782667.1 putative carboxypeptidase D [Helianthus annuus]KAJ0875782.1 putative carboxypeptidase D [Helianthus annuus]
MAFYPNVISMLKIIVVLLLSKTIFVVARHGQWSKEEKVNVQNVKDLVTNLPGQPSVDFRHYAGYVTVNEKKGRALFYWFYEAWTLPHEKPLVLWLNGGPGCSSVGYGATQEIGPFIVNTDGKGLHLNPYSWNREANMLFLESPVGVGFSYSNTANDYDNLGDDLTAKDAYAFLHNWFQKFPSFKNRTFYIAGESYAGKYVPELAGLIHDKNNDASLYINLKGILLGNPETNDAEDWKGLIDYAWSHAVVSDETHKIIRENCDFNSNNTWSNEDCSQAVDEVLAQYSEIDIYSLYTSVCITNSAYADNKAMQVVFKKSSSKMMPRIMGGYDPCLDDYAKSYYNKPEVQKALHVGDGLNLKNWTICNMDIFNGWAQSKDSVLPIYKKLIDAKFRIWVYSGDTDGRVPVLSTRYSLSSLGLPITRAWRPWYHQKQVAGWLQEYEGLTFATFRGAGHAVPIFKPSESLAFFTSFLLGKNPPLKR